MRRAAVLLLFLTGCALESNLEPAEPLDALDASETAQLCRFTTDVLMDTDGSCAPDAPVSLRSFEACTADPPWDECATPAGETNDIASWEECVNELTGAFCGASDAPCWHFRCR